MKRIFLSVIMLAFVVGAKSQVSFKQTTSNPTGVIVNTAADTMTYKLTKGYSLLSIQPVLLKNSGTLAGKTLLQYSVNGTDYISSDSLTHAQVADGAKLTTSWTKAIPARYWRIIVNGGTTMNVTCTATLNTN